jgi:hypothetical protein
MASGRFETLGEILTRDNLLFPLLRRCMEGRALRAVGPPTEEVPTSDGGSRAVITLSGHKRWTPRAGPARYVTCLLYLYVLCLIS